MTITEKLKDAALATACVVGGITAGSIYVAAKTVTTVVKLPVSIICNSAKKIHRMNDCCKTIFDSVSNNHKDCFDHYCDKMNSDVMVRALKQIPERLIVDREDIEMDMEDDIAKVTEFNKKLKNRYPNKFCLDSIDIDLYTSAQEDLKKNRLYRRRLNQSYQIFKELLDVSEKKDARIKFREFKSFVRDCLTKFNTPEMLTHVLTKIPIECFEPEKIRYAYTYYRHQPENSGLLSNENLYTPVLNNRSKFRNILTDISNMLDLEDTNNMYWEHINEKKCEGLLSKEELDNCIKFHYINHSNYAFVLWACMEKNSVYLRSYIEHYGNLYEDFAADDSTIKYLGHFMEFALTRKRRSDTDYLIVQELLKGNKLVLYMFTPVIGKYHDRREKLEKLINNEHLADDLISTIVDYAI